MILIVLTTIPSFAEFYTAAHLSFCTHTKTFASIKAKYCRLQTKFVDVCFYIVIVITCMFSPSFFRGWRERRSENSSWWRGRSGVQLHVFPLHFCLGVAVHHDAIDKLAQVRNSSFLFHSVWCLNFYRRNPDCMSSLSPINWPVMPPSYPS